MILAPAECRRRQVAAPTRFAPPVISTTLPCTRRSGYTRTASKPNTSMAHTPSRDDRANMPPPTDDALDHSARVAAHIERVIVASGGWISFADYMGAALYAPGLGYYVAGARKFGSAGDFVTAPEMTTLFGEALAAQIAEVLVRIPDGAVIELGPGTGRLAADVLGALAARDALPEKYCLLEVSPDLRERQRDLLRQRVPDL